MSSQNSHNILHETHLLSDTSIHAIAGALAGTLSGIVVCPLDVIKTRLQAQGAFDKQRGSLKGGFTRTMDSIVKHDGVRGLYRGVIPIILGYSPTWMIYFAVYEKSKYLLSTVPQLDPYPFFSHCLSALGAGAASTTLTNPIWVVKTRLMSQGPNTSWHYKGTWDAFKTMYKTDGIRVFYSGLGPALLGLSHVAIQFPMYEKLKVMLGVSPDSNKPNPWAVTVASSLSKMIASAITYPHEIVRTRMQIQSKDGQYRGIIASFKKLYQEEGFRIFYTGFGTNLLRTVPASAITLLSFEMISSRLKQIL